MDICCGCGERTVDVRRQFDYAKWGYCICFTLVAVITWLLRDFADQWFLDHSGAFGYCSDSKFASLCSSKEVALRISFANCVFFLAHAALLLCCSSEEDPRTVLHTGMWFWRLLIWAGTIVGFFFVPADAVSIYGQVARAGAALFLVFIMVELVTWFYDISGRLVDADSTLAWVALVGGAFVSFAGGLVFIGFSFYYYAPAASCGLNIFFCVWSLLMGIAFVAILFVPKRQPAAGLLTSGAVFVYCSFLLISALSSEPNTDSCVRMAGVSQKWITVVGFFLGIGSVAYSTLSLGTSRLMGGQEGGSADPELKVGLPYRPDTFHLIYALASMYLAMLFTNWQISSSTSAFDLGVGYSSMWAKMASKWFCELLYVWTVLAPCLLPNRDFS